MFIWGAGPALGILTFLGYVFFLLGAAIVWPHRGAVSVWIDEEISTFRRSVSRYRVVGPFYGLREESRSKVLAACFVCSLRRMSRSPIFRGAILLFAGPLLLLLDFFL
jgi:hypothetical protein